MATQEGLTKPITKSEAIELINELHDLITTIPDGEKCGISGLKGQQIAVAAWEPSGTVRQELETHDRLEIVVIPHYWNGINLTVARLSELHRDGKMNVYTEDVTLQHGGAFEYKGDLVVIRFADMLNFGGVLALSSSSREYANALVRSIQRGGKYKVTSFGYLINAEESEFRAGHPLHTIPCPTEKHFFAAANLKVPHPSKRFTKKELEVR